MNKYQFKHKTQLGTAYYYCYGDDRFETYLRINMIPYKKLEENEESGKNLFKEKDKEIEKLERENTIMKKYFQNIIDIGFDYDGYNESDDLKRLIDELVKYASYGRDADDTKVMYVNGEEKYNILMEKIGDDKE